MRTYYMYGPGSAQPLLRFLKRSQPQSCFPEPLANFLMSAFEMGSWSMYWFAGNPSTANGLPAYCVPSEAMPCHSSTSSRLSRWRR